MQEKEPKTSVGLVLAILHRERGLYYSTFEIREMILDAYCIGMRLELIRDCLHELAPVLSVKEERRGMKKKPFNLYCLPQKINQNV